MAFQRVLRIHLCTAPRQACSRTQGNKVRELHIKHAGVIEPEDIRTGSVSWMREHHVSRELGLARRRPEVPDQDETMEELAVHPPSGVPLEGEPARLPLGLQPDNLKDCFPSTASSTKRTFEGGSSSVNQPNPGDTLCH